MSNSFAPILTADDEPTERRSAAAMAATIRASRPSLGMVAHHEPVLPVVVAYTHSGPGFWQRLSRRVRVAVADFLLGDIRWDEKRVLSAAMAERERGIVWDKSGEVLDLRAWKDAQIEREHATYALAVAMGQVHVP
jgi:hypothetical protein